MSNKNGSLINTKPFVNTFSNTRLSIIVYYTVPACKESNVSSNENADHYRRPRLHSVAVHFTSQGKADVSILEIKWAQLCYCERIVK